MNRQPCEKRPENIPMPEAVRKYRHVAKQVVHQQGFYTIVSVADAAIGDLAEYAADGWCCAELWKTRAEQADAERDALRVKQKLGSPMLDFVFDWFNEHDPDAVAEALDAYEERGEASDEDDL